MKAKTKAQEYTIIIKISTSMIKYTCENLAVTGDGFDNLLSHNISAKYISLVRFVTILVEMKSKLNYILITSFKSLGITSFSLNISRFKIMLLRPR